MAREGLPFVGVGLALALLSWLASQFYPSLALGVGLFGVLSLFMVFFFRDPNRTPPAGDNLVLSAADGKVVHIEDIEREEHLKGAAVQVSTFLSPFDVHVNRIPFSGVVDFVKWHRGRFYAAFVAAASTENEQSIIGIRNGETRIVVKQIVGILARRIVCYLNAGDAINKGEKFGLIRFGSRVDLILPARAQLRVKVGDRVRAGETIIGVIDDVPGNPS
jgi:phosphatidylserine decarboxylase